MNSLKVHAPSAVVIVCGGETDIDLSQPLKSLRDAFLRIAPQGKLAKFDIRKAEDVVSLPQQGYSNLVELESDLAQISELVLLFTESPGSLVELGIFVMDEEIASRLLVVVDAFNYNRNSFTKLGALHHLESKFGDGSVCVIDLLQHGGERIENVKSLDVPSFQAFITDKIAQRLAARPEPRTFDPKRAGHLVKLVTGLIQNYGSLTIDEIDTLLYCLNYPIRLEDIRRLLGCAELFGWIKIQKNGTRTFYSAVGGALAIQFDLADGVKPLNKSKWRSDVRQYWKDCDPDRFSCLSSAATA